MKTKLPLTQQIADSLDEFRLQTAKPDALIQLSLLALLVGLLTGITIVVFIIIIDTVLSYWLPNHLPDNFEALPAITRFAAPVIGTIILAILFKFASKEEKIVGVVHVIERLRYHEGYLKIKSFVLQFVGACIALISGQSLGREGPAIHLGSFVGSILGQSFGLPNNTIRILLACGAAAAISAAFNTPLAGVIFAMEIIIVEYTFVSFIPIIIAAVAATGVSRSFLGGEPILLIESLPSLSLSELPFLILLGLLIGFASTLFTTIIRFTVNKTEHFKFSTRFIGAGVFTGIVAIYVPQVLGLGYDTLNEAIIGQLSISVLLFILFAKLLTTAVSIGCGLPAGLISPSLVIGAVCGSLMAIFMQQSFSIPIESNSLYALIGMSAMMGACLQAPLAALTAVFEITANHAVIWPSMIAIVVAQLITRQLFKQPPVFDMLLELRGLDFHEDPITQSLQRTGVAKAMNRSFIAVTRTIEPSSALSILNSNPQWIVIIENLQPTALIRGVDLVQHLQKEPTNDEPVDLFEIPAKRLQISCIDVRATMAKAREVFSNDHSEALCVTHWNKNSSRYIYGILTLDQFETLYMR